MSQAKYIPGSDADKGIWLNNYTAKMAVYASVLGITPAELSALQDDNNMYQYIINMIESYRQNLLNLTGYKNMLKSAVGQQHIGSLPAPPVLAAPPVNVAEGVFDRVTKLATKIKNSAGYTDNIGSDLGIIASVESIDVDAMQPDLKIKLDVGRPHLKWTKGYADAIDLYADHNDGAGFALAGRLLKSEYMDLADLAAGKVYDEWKYKAIFVISDMQVGLYSKITSIDVKKQ